MTALLLPFVSPARASDLPGQHEKRIHALENRFLEGDADAGLRRLLRDPDVAKTLPPELWLRWMRLCRMAGEFGAATALCRKMLSRGGRDAEEARSCLADLAGLAGAGPVSGEPLEPDLQSALDQARKMRLDGVRLRHFLSRFQGRPDAFARMWQDKTTGKTGYFPVRRPMGEEDLRRHLQGTETLGIYLLDAQHQVRCAVLDADLLPEFRDRKGGAAQGRIRREARWLLEEGMRRAGLQGMCAHPALSGGKGYHLWFSFERPLPAVRARALLRPVASLLNAGQGAFRVEVFPKQNELSGKGLGSLVKLPLGVHLKTGKRAWFLGLRDRDLQAQLGHGARLSLSPVPKIVDFDGENAEGCGRSFLSEKGGQGAAGGGLAEDLGNLKVLVDRLVQRLG